MGAEHKQRSEVYRLHYCGRLEGVQQERRTVAETDD